MRIASTILALTWVSVAIAGEVKFSKKPTATRAGDKVVISFALAGPTDVAVEVLGREGKIVRHLGGASLAAKNPPPPFKPGLSQAIEWDGRDDRGKKAEGGPFSVRVRLGLKAEFDRFIGWTQSPPLGYDLVNALVVTPDRKIYVISISRDAPRSGRSENRIVVLSPEGKYLKTLYPYPATMDPAKLRGVDFMSAEKNRLQPRVYDRVCVSTLPQMRAVNRQTMDVTSDGRLVFASGWGTELYSFGPRALMVMKTDGSIPRERLDGPNFGPGTSSGVKAGYTHLALSPDEKSVYLCGLAASRYGKHENVVYRAGLGIKDKPQVIFGKPGQAGSGKDGLNEPRGIGVDGKGRVYISDFGNHRIVVLEPSGEYAGEIPV
ncbi:MAG: SMP-30/gluconolactonase/LRE family protein, partial [Planctomycetota bacterium]